MNDPTGRKASAYFDAISDAEEAVADALAAMRAEEAGRITPVEAATERVVCWKGTWPNAGDCAVSCWAGRDGRHGVKIATMSGGLGPQR